MDEKKRKKRQSISISRKNVLDLGFTIGIILIACLVSSLLVHYSKSSANVTAVFTLAVLLTARVTDGYGWGIAASIIGVVAVNYAFTDPFFQLDFTTAGYPIIFASMTLISVVTSATTGSVKLQARRAKNSEEHTRRLYDFSQKLASAQNADQMIDLAMQYLHDQLGCPVLYLEDENDIRENRERIVGEIGGFVSDAIEHSAISDCFREVCDTGVGTIHSPYARFHYIPVPGSSGMLGCIGLLWNKGIAEEEIQEHVRAILAQTGISLERQRLAEERNRAAMTADREKLRSICCARFRTICAHRSPASSAHPRRLRKTATASAQRKRARLAADIHEDAEWLLRMVENLLSVTRVSQVAELKKSEEAAEEVIVEAVSRCKKRFPDAQIRVDLPEDDMLFVPMDATLIVQVLINLMENAVRYAQTPIDIGLRRDGAWAEFSVRDFGPGIADDKKENLFDSVQAQPDSRRGGLGIGLTLCRSIITAHGGEIWEVNHPDGGAQFLFTLPLEEEEK